MAYRASLIALERSGLDTQDIDMIIVATTTPERIFPSSAVLLQNKLKIDDSFAFDINAACTGFIYALDVADKYIKNNIVSNVLVVGTEKMSSIVDWGDRNTCVLFGDGAGACMVSSSDKPGIISSKIGSNGSYKDLLTVNPDTDFIEMKGNEILKKAEEIENNSNQLLNYTNIIKENSLDIKRDIVEHLWKVIISDNTVDQYESNLMRRICGLIYFSDKECAEIKLKLMNSK